MPPRPRATPPLAARRSEARTCPERQTDVTPPPPATCPERHLIPASSRAALVGLLTWTLGLPARAAPTVETSAPVDPSSSGVSDPGDAGPDAPPPAPAADQAEALRLFRAARILYTAGQHREAALGFEASFAAAASPEAAYNAALAHDRDGDVIATMKWFRRYLAVGRPESDPSYPLALRRVEELRARVGELRLRIDHPEGLREIRVNGVPVAIEEFPRLVEPGRIEVRFIGERPDQVVDIPSEVPAGGPSTIHFPGFTAAPAPAEPKPVDPPIVRPEPGPDPRSTPRHRRLRAAFWTGVGLTGASALAMGVLGGVVLRARADYSTTYDPFVPYEPDPSYPANAAAQARYLDFKLATNVMIGVTAGLAVITLALGIVTLRDGRQARAITRAAQVRFTSGGLQLAF